MLTFPASTHDFHVFPPSSKFGTAKCKTSRSCGWTWISPLELWDTCDITSWFFRGLITNINQHNWVAPPCSSSWLRTCSCSRNAFLVDDWQNLVTNPLCMEVGHIAFLFFYEQFSRLKPVFFYNSTFCCLAPVRISSVTTKLNQNVSVGLCEKKNTRIWIFHNIWYVYTYI